MINKVILGGRVGNDIEVNYTTSGRPYITFSLATNRPYKDKNGNWQRVTDWHRIRIFGKRAEGLAKILKKGDLIAVEGRLAYFTVEGEQGKRKFAYVMARDIQILKTNGKTREEVISDTIEPEIAEDIIINEDDIPF